MESALINQPDSSIDPSAVEAAPLRTMPQSIPLTVTIMPRQNDRTSISLVHVFANVQRNLSDKAYTRLPANLPVPTPNGRK